MKSDRKLVLTDLVWLMANVEHVKILKQGVTAWNKWREEQTGITPNLQLTHLNGVDLSRANLSEANLSKVDFTLADLSGADLSGAHLGGTRLGGADLSGAHLGGVYLNSSDLSHADLSRAQLGWTVFCNIDLSETIGLETVQHIGPSTIGVDTILKSKGNIPHKFLLDSGMPQEVIDYLLPLAGKAINFYSCFISYSSQDQAFAERLHADLQAKGVRCWFAPHDIQGGKKIHEQLDEAIQVYDKLLLVLSEGSIKSPWVDTEIYKARHREEVEKRRMLFPISLVEYDTVKRWQAFDADSGKDMGREVREYFIPDFTHWKDHDAYQKAFERLLRDLKAPGSLPWR